MKKWIVLVGRTVGGTTLPSVRASRAFKRCPTRRVHQYHEMFLSILTLQLSESCIISRDPNAGEWWYKK
eukprot:scaffold64021_cov58-Attheya_sp.AAC.2